MDVNFNVIWIPNFEFNNFFTSVFIDYYTKLSHKVFINDNDNKT